MHPGLGFVKTKTVRRKTSRYLCNSTDRIFAIIRSSKFSLFKRTLQQSHEFELVWESEVMKNENECKLFLIKTNVF
ncbi:unnamed protein product [Hymenolepis diminuta]|uniref:Uncharacterized protein n=1 Tax=Hymenolepis diminuta TaxID=6216 RepID=A0A564YXJ8_HYMDI|nr:unnamed protein product [Hymenolepis diminuta]